MKYKRVISQFIALFLAVVMVATSLQPSAVAEPLSLPLLVPANLGRAENFFKENQVPRAFLILDAHTSIQAQKNIAELIHYLVERNKVSTVLEEGYEGPVDTDEFFSEYEAASERQRVADLLLDKLRLGGAEYAHLFRQKDFELIGMDSDEGQRANLLAAQKLSRYLPLIEQELDVLDTAVQSAIKNQVPKFAWEIYQNKKAGISLGTFPEVYLKKLAEESAAIDEGSEFSRLLEMLKGEDSSRPEINIKKLIFELNAQEERVLEKLIPDEQILAAFQDLLRLVILRRLVRLQISPEEYDALKFDFQKIRTTTAEVAARVNSLTKRPQVFARHWEWAIEYAFMFYEAAHLRDIRFKASINEMIRQKNNKWIMVCGGFHRQAVEDSLKENKVPYAVILPKIESLSRRHEELYQERLAEPFYSFEEKFIKVLGQSARLLSGLQIIRANRQDEEPLGVLMQRYIEAIALGSSAVSVSQRSELRVPPINESERTWSESRIMDQGQKTLLFVTADQRDQVDGLTDLIDERARPLERPSVVVTIQSDRDFEDLLHAVHLAENGQYELIQGPLSRVLKENGILVINYARSAAQRAEGFNSAFDENAYWREFDQLKNLTIIGIMEDDRFSDYPNSLYSRFKQKFNFEFENVPSDPLRGHVFTNGAPAGSVREVDLKGRREAVDDLVHRYKLENGLAKVSKGELVQALEEAKANPDEPFSFVVREAELELGSPLYQLLRNLFLNKKIIYNGKEEIELPDNFKVYILPQNAEVYEARSQKTKLIAPKVSVEGDSEVWVINHLNVNLLFSQNFSSEGALTVAPGILDSGDQTASPKRIRVTGNLPAYAWHALMDSRQKEIEVADDVDIPAEYVKAIERETGLKENAVPDIFSKETVQSVRSAVVEGQDADLIVHRVRQIYGDEKVAVHSVDAGMTIADVAGVFDSVGDGVIQWSTAEVIKQLQSGKVVVLKNVRGSPGLLDELVTALAEDPYLIVNGKRETWKEQGGVLIVTDAASTETQRLENSQAAAHRFQVSGDFGAIRRVLEQEFPGVSEEEWQALDDLQALFKNIPSPVAAGKRARLYPAKFQMTLSLWRQLLNEKKDSDWLDAFELYALGAYSGDSETAGYMRVMVKLAFRQQLADKFGRTVDGEKLKSLLDSHHPMNGWETNRYWDAADTLSPDLLVEAEFKLGPISQRSAGGNFELIKQALIQAHADRGVIQAESAYRKRFDMQEPLLDAPNLSAGWFEDGKSTKQYDAQINRAESALRRTHTVMLEGSPGSGKTYSAKLLTARLGLNPDQDLHQMTAGPTMRRQDFLNSAAFKRWEENGGVLFIDEANLPAEDFWSFLEDYLDRPAENGSTRYLVFTGNQNYFEGRQAPKITHTRMPVVPFSPLSDAHLMQILTPAVKDANPAEVLDLVLRTHHAFEKAAGENVYSLRDLQELVARMNEASPNEVWDRKLLARIFWHLYSGHLSAIDQAAMPLRLQNSFPATAEEITAPLYGEAAAFFQTEDLVMTESTEALADVIFGFLNSRETRIKNPGSELGGKYGIILEGPSGRLKTELVQKIVSKRKENSEFTGRVYQVTATPNNAKEIQRLILLAREEGSLLIIDEINLLDSKFLEGAMNDALTGEASPGFGLIGTMNTADFSGRQKLSSAFLNRVIYRNVPAYTQAEMRQIARGLLDESQAEQLAAFHAWLRSQIQDASRHPTVREFKAAAALIRQGEEFERAIRQVYGLVFFDKLGVDWSPEMSPSTWAEDRGFGNLQVLSRVAGLMLPAGKPDPKIVLFSGQSSNAGSYDPITNTIHVKVEAGQRGFTQDNWNTVLHELSHAIFTTNYLSTNVDPIVQDLEDLRHLASLDHFFSETNQNVMPQDVRDIFRAAIQDSDPRYLLILMNQSEVSEKKLLQWLLIFYAMETADMDSLSDRQALANQIKAVAKRVLLAGEAEPFWKRWVKAPLRYLLRMFGYFGSLNLRDLVARQRGVIIPGLEHNPLDVDFRFLEMARSYALSIPQSMRAEDIHLAQLNANEALTSVLPELTEFYRSLSSQIFTAQEPEVKKPDKSSFAQTIDSLNQGSLSFRPSLVPNGGSQSRKDISLSNAALAGASVTAFLTTKKVLFKFPGSQLLSRYGIQIYLKPNVAGLVKNFNRVIAGVSIAAIVFIMAWNIPLIVSIWAQISLMEVLTATLYGVGAVLAAVAVAYFFRFYTDGTDGEESGGHSPHSANEGEERPEDVILSDPFESLEARENANEISLADFFKPEKPGQEEVKVNLSEISKQIERDLDLAIRNFYQEKEEVGHVAALQGRLNIPMFIKSGGDPRLSFESLGGRPEMTKREIILVDPSGNLDGNNPIRRELLGFIVERGFSVKVVTEAPKKTQALVIHFDEFQKRIEESYLYRAFAEAYEQNAIEEEERISDSAPDSEENRLETEDGPESTGGAEEILAEQKQIILDFAREHDLSVNFVVVDRNYFSASFSSRNPNRPVEIDLSRFNPAQGLKQADFGNLHVSFKGQSNHIVALSVLRNPGQLHDDWLRMFPALDYLELTIPQLSGEQVIDAPMDFRLNSRLKTIQVSMASASDSLLPMLFKTAAKYPHINIYHGNIPIIAGREKTLESSLEEQREQANKLLGDTPRPSDEVGDHVTMYALNTGISRSVTQKWANLGRAVKMVLYAGYFELGEEKLEDVWPQIVDLNDPIDNGKAEGLRYLKRYDSSYFAEASQEEIEAFLKAHPNRENLVVVGRLFGEQTGTQYQYTVSKRIKAVMGDDVVLLSADVSTSEGEQASSLMDLEDQKRRIDDFARTNNLKITTRFNHVTQKIGIKISPKSSSANPREVSLDPLSDLRDLDAIELDVPQGFSFNYNFTGKSLKLVKRFKSNLGFTDRSLDGLIRRLPNVEVLDLTSERALSYGYSFPYEDLLHLRELYVTVPPNSGESVREQVLRKFSHAKVYHPNQTIKIYLNGEEIITGQESLAPETELEAARKVFSKVLERNKGLGGKVIQLEDGSVSVELWSERIRKDPRPGKGGHTAYEFDSLDLSLLAEIPNLKNLELSLAMSPKAKKAGAVKLAVLPQVKHLQLYLMFNWADESFLKHFPGLEKLEINFNHPKARPEFSDFAVLPSLRELRVLVYKDSEENLVGKVGRNLAGIMTKHPNPSLKIYLNNEELLKREDNPLLEARAAEIRKNLNRRIQNSGLSENWADSVIEVKEGSIKADFSGEFLSWEDWGLILSLLDGVEEISFHLTTVMSDDFKQLPKTVKKIFFGQATHVSDWSFLSGLAHLEEIDFSVTDISENVLMKLPRTLKRLHLSEDQLRRFSSLRGYRGFVGPNAVEVVVDGVPIPRVLADDAKEAGQIPSSVDSADNAREEIENKVRRGVDIATKSGLFFPRVEKVEFTSTFIEAHLNKDRSEEDWVETLGYFEGVNKLTLSGAVPERAIEALPESVIILNLSGVGPFLLPSLIKKIPAHIRELGLPGIHKSDLEQFFERTDSTGPGVFQLRFGPVREEGNWRLKQDFTDDLGNDAVDLDAQKKAIQDFARIHDLEVEIDQVADDYLFVTLHKGRFEGVTLSLDGLRNLPALKKIRFTGGLMLNSVTGEPLTSVESLDYLAGNMSNTSSELDPRASLGKVFPNVKHLFLNWRPFLSINYGSVIPWGAFPELEIIEVQSLEVINILESSSFKKAAFKLAEQHPNAKNLRIYVDGVPIISGQEETLESSLVDQARDIYPERLDAQTLEDFKNAQAIRAVFFGAEDEEDETKFSMLSRNGYAHLARNMKSTDPSGISMWQQVSSIEGANQWLDKPEELWKLRFLRHVSAATYFRREREVERKIISFLNLHPNRENLIVELQLSDADTEVNEVKFYTFSKRLKAEHPDAILLDDKDALLNEMPRAERPPLGPIVDLSNLGRPSQEAKNLQGVWAALVDKSEAVKKARALIEKAQAPEMLEAFNSWAEKRGFARSELRTPEMPRFSIPTVNGEVLFVISAESLASKDILTDGLFQELLAMEKPYGKNIRIHITGQASSELMDYRLQALRQFFGADRVYLDQTQRNIPRTLVGKAVGFEPRGRNFLVDKRLVGRSDFAAGMFGVALVFAMNPQADQLDQDGYILDPSGLAAQFTRMLAMTIAVSISA